MRLTVPCAVTGFDGVSATILQSKQWLRYKVVPSPLLKYLYNGKEVVFRDIRLVDKRGIKKKNILHEENSVRIHAKKGADRVMPTKKLPKGHMPNTDRWHGFDI